MSSTDLEQKNIEPTIVWLASFDIGKKNFAFCIEEINLDDLQSIQNISKNDRYYKDGTSTPEFTKILKKVCTNGKIILIDNIDLTYDTDKSQYLDPLIFVNMNTVLDRYKEYWNKCTSFVIEQQMGFGNKRNYMALKLGQHCFSYFIFNYANFKQTVEFPSYYKTKVLGSGKKLSKYQRKTWAVHKAMDILADREDHKSMEIINNRKKRDDVSDVIVQLQSYKYLVFVDKSI
jgi:hypothetical protein